MTGPPSTNGTGKDDTGSIGDAHQQSSPGRVSPTRERLLATAARLFHEQGYSATGISTILRESGVRSGSLYHFFQGKEDLLMAVLERYRELLQPVVLGPCELAEPDPIKRIFHLLAWYREGMLESGCRLGCPIGNLALEVSDCHPGARELIDANFSDWTAGIERWLNEAGDRLPAGCNTRALARFILTVMEGGLMQARAADKLEPFDDSVAVLREHLELLLVRSAATDPQATSATPTASTTSTASTASTASTISTTPTASTTSATPTASTTTTVFQQGESP